jgi:hypothetical protein
VDTRGRRQAAKIGNCWGKFESNWGADGSDRSGNSITCFSGENNSEKSHTAQPADGLKAKGDRHGSGGSGRTRTEGEEMTPSEAKLRILAEWRTWVGHQQSAVSHTTAEALAFFKEIEQNKPDLLSFDSADKWEFVKGWLLNAGLIKP